MKQTLTKKQLRMQQSVLLTIATHVDKIQAVANRLYELPMGHRHGFIMSGDIVVTWHQGTQPSTMTPRRNGSIKSITFSDPEPW